MIVDPHVPNESTKPTSWPIPNLKDELHDLHGSEVFATLDFFKAIGRCVCQKTLKTVSRS
jgi:hypothetical protein